MGVRQIPEEVFISYSHDSVEHVERVLQLSNRLRSEGVDCVLDQYEESPPEGWPRWMDKKIRDAQYVLMVCTEPYFKRVMGEEAEGTGLGVRWEGNLIYQHFYNAGALNHKFIPVLFKQEHAKFIPTPLQGATYYCLATDSRYDDLYMRLTNQRRVEKPELGKRRALPAKTVKTNPALYISTPIDVGLWEAAAWRATFFLWEPDKPPVLGLAFRNKTLAREIFAGWHARYGDSDGYEELRVSIVEGDLHGEEPGYSVHIGADPSGALKRLKAAGYEFDRDLLLSISRINRMNPPISSQNLAKFKDNFRRFKCYFLAPGVVSQDGTLFEPMLDLRIFKRVVHFRHVSDIGKNDLDAVVLRTGEVKRARVQWGKKDTKE
jgi:hypothetical protein